MRKLIVTRKHFHPFIAKVFLRFLYYRMFLLMIFNANWNQQSSFDPLLQTNLFTVKKNKCYVLILDQKYVSRIFLFFENLIGDHIIMYNYCRLQKS